MAVFINFKICDNASECSGIEVCPAGALTYDINLATLVTDNSKCISCDACVGVCPAGAILVAHNDTEAAEIVKDIADDPRTLEALMVERYGASPVDKSILIEVVEALRKIQEIGSLLVIDVIDDEDAPCLINSVPISEIFSDRTYEYYKISLNDESYGSFADKYDVVDCPTLLVFLNNELLTRMDGMVDNADYQQRSKLIQKVDGAL